MASTAYRLRLRELRRHARDRGRLRAERHHAAASHTGAADPHGDAGPARAVGDGQHRDDPARPRPAGHDDREPGAVPRRGAGGRRPRPLRLARPRRRAALGHHHRRCVVGAFRFARPDGRNGIGFANLDDGTLGQTNTWSAKVYRRKRSCRFTSAGRRCRIIRRYVGNRIVERERPSTSRSPGSRAPRTRTRTSSTSRRR